MVWILGNYLCDKCDIVLNEEDKVVQVQYGYLVDEGQSFEDNLKVRDFHYHKACYVKILRK